MELPTPLDSAKKGWEWLWTNCGDPPEEIEKPTQQTRAWFATINGRAAFIKWYPTELCASWAKVEAAISGANLHPAIIPLRQKIRCTDGTLLLYDRVPGTNLGPQDARQRFQALPLSDRANVVIAVSGALTAICDAGFMVVDWYEGNMLYDFDNRKIWLFDWELCREGGALLLDMDSNYGSSRLMAPEEFVRGSRLDQRTLVFNVGRYALLTLPELAEPLAPLLARATYPAGSGRYGAMSELTAALRQAL